MKNTTKIALLAAAAALVSQGAQAAFQVDDLYVGFTKSGSSDYIIDLGQATTAVGAGGSAVVNLSSSFSLNTFNTVFGSGASGVQMSVVGGNNHFGSYDVYTTTLRSGGAGAPATPGSDLTGVYHSQSFLSGAAASLTSIPVPAAGSSAVDTTHTFSTQVLGSFNSFYSHSTINPAIAVGFSAPMYADLWHATTSGGYQYQGYFTMDLSGSQPSFTFTPELTAVPEPATYGYGVLAAGSILVASLRNRFRRKQQA